MAWFVKLEEGVVPKPQFDRVVPEHLAWLAELERCGHRPVSGYWAERKGRSGAGGMLLFWADSWDQAEALVQQDPLIRRGCVRWTLHHWQPVFGEPLLRSGTAAPGLSSAGETPAPPGSGPAPPAGLP